MFFPVTAHRTLFLPFSPCVGLGESKAAEAPAAVGEPAPAEFLKQVCDGLNTGPVVVISPSLSGMYSLPFLFQHSEQLKAYIPVAPICTDKFKAEQYKDIQVSVCVCVCMFVIYGLQCLYCDKHLKLGLTWYWASHHLQFLFPF